MSSWNKHEFNTFEISFPNALPNKSDGGKMGGKNVSPQQSELKHSTVQSSLFVLLSLHCNSAQKHYLSKHKDGISY